MGSTALHAEFACSACWHRVPSPCAWHPRAGTLLLRRVLRHDNPAHEALLDAEAAARGIGIKRDEADDDGGGASSGESAARRRVKRERDGRAAELLALMVARPPVDPTVEQACDLTANEDAPAWSAKKRATQAGVA